MGNKKFTLERPKFANFNSAKTSKITNSQTLISANISSFTVPAWMFRRSNQKTEKSAPKERDSKKKPAQPKENDDRSRQNMKLKEGATEEECVARPVVTRAQAKKSD